MVAVQNGEPRQHASKQATTGVCHRGKAVCFFFFQAEDGIRDIGVTGVQTCALPISVGGSAITRHPWVIAVAACDTRGRPMPMSNLGSAVGRGGLMAPGEAITSLSAEDRKSVVQGKSVDLGGRRIIKKKTHSTVDGWY